MTVARRMKELAVRGVKPRVSPNTWDSLRDPRTTVRLAVGTSPSLTDLAQHHGTDKWSHLHKYTPHYERHLGHLRKERFTLFEIGIGGYRREGQGGASLRMWKEFFPRADIIGLDIEDKSFVNEPRIKSYKGSQVDPKILDRILARTKSDIKVVIDDGSHRPEHIRASFAYLFPRLPDDVTYVIEDTQTSYWPHWGGSVNLHEPSTTVGFAKDLLDGLHYEEFAALDYRPTYYDERVVGLHAYHNMVFIEKGDNREGGGENRRAKAVAAAAKYPAAPPVAEQREGWSVPAELPTATPAAATLP